MKKFYFIIFLFLITTKGLLAQEQGIFFNQSPLSSSGEAGVPSEIHFQMTDFFGDTIRNLGYLDPEQQEPGRFEIIGPDAADFKAFYNYPFIGDDPFIFFYPDSPGTKEATLVVYHNLPGSPDSVKIVGIAGVSLEPDLVFQETSPIDFGRVNLGSSVNRTVTIKNQGNTDLNITGYAMDRNTYMTDRDQFQLVNARFPMVIPPSGAVVLDLLFTPTSPADSGTFNDGFSTKGAVGVELTFESNDPDYGAGSIDLEATESEPNIAVQNAFDFGRISVGDTSVAAITVKNTADGDTDGDLVITGLSFSGANASAFSAASTFPMTIAPGDSADISVKFLPETEGTATATLAIEGNKSAQTSLTGEGTVQYLDVISSIDFGTIRWRTNPTQSYAEKYIALISEGAEDITITDIRLNGDPEDLAVYSSGLPLTVTPGNLQNILLDLKSTATTGKKTATLTVTSDAINSPHTVAVNYNIVYPVIELSDTQISMSGAAGTTQEASFAITNTGTDELSIIDIQLEGTNPEQFELVGLPPEIIDGAYFLPVGESLTIKVRHTFTTTDNLTAKIAINALDEDQAMAYVTVNANLQAPVVTFSENSINFGDALTASETIDTIFTLTNTGTADLNLSDINISGTNASEFLLNGITLPLTIAPGSSIDINVSFSPQSTGVKNAQVNVISNEVGSPATFPITGRGIAPVVDIASNINMRDVPINKTSSEIKVDVRNTGLYPLEINNVKITGANASLFTLKPVTTPVTIAPGESTSLFFTFSPVQAGTFSAQLELQSNDLNSPNLSTISGKGILVPEIYYDPDPVVFPTVAIGDPKIVKYVVFENKGSADLHLAHAGFLGIGFFNMEQFNLPRIIPPGGKDSLKVVYQPRTSGPFAAHLNVYSEDNYTSKIASVPLQGYAKGSQIQLSTYNLYFGTTTIGGDTDTLSINVNNGGETDLVLDYMRPDENAIFQIYYDSVEYPSTLPTYIPVTVPPGASQKVNVVFKPNAVGDVESIINIISRDPFNELTNHPITVRGTGKEPEQVTVGGITLKADVISDYGTDIKLLTGNVHSDKLKFTGNVLVNLVTKEITGTGDVYVTDIPKVGNYGGEVVKLQEDGFAYKAQDDAAELVIQGGLAGVSGAFKLMGLPLEITKFNLIPDGIRVGGNLTLPPEVFGPKAGIFIDSLEITSTNGVQVVGRASLSPALKIQNVLQLNKAYVEFNTYEDNFSGGGEIGFNVLNRGVNIGAGIVIKKGMLDAVTMEIEVSPGIPLGATGWSLAGGNGFIKGLQTPPISLGLGVDLRPTVPAGGAEIIRMDNMTISYTFGTSFDGSGTLQIFGENVAGGSISVSLQKISVQAFINLYRVFSGDIAVAMTFGDNNFSVEGSAKLAVSIPKLENCSVCDMFPGILPYKVADASVYFNNTKISASVTIHLLVINVGVDVAVIFENPNARVEVGANLSVLNGSLASSSNARVATARMLPDANGSITYEHDEAEMQKNRLEGQSIILNTPKMANNARMLGSAEDITEFSFDIHQPYKTLFIRVVDEYNAPDFSVILPTGQEITAENAASMGIYHNINPDKNLGVYVMNNALIGTYKLKIKGSGPHEIDFFGAEFGPSLTLENTAYDKVSNEVDITWTDEDSDSDAKVSLFYDIDQTGSNGIPIVRDLSENDETDHFVWKMDSLKNGTYYIYAVIDDGMNTPVPVYSSEPFTVNKPSPIPVPVLEVPERSDDSDIINLSWSAVEGASHYLVYYDEDTVTFNSTNINVGNSAIIKYGNVIYYKLSTLEKGRTYQLAVTAVTNDFVESNLSNSYTVGYTSTIANNTPEITTPSFVGKVDAGESYQTTIAYTDADQDDILTLALTTAPSGMTIAQDGVINWATTSDQVGQHQVKVLLSDNHGGKDSLSFIVVVFDEKSSQGILTMNKFRFNGANEEAMITLKDPDLNSQNTVSEQTQVKVYSGFDKTGITVTLEETGVNTGTFKGSFGFGSNDTHESGPIKVATVDSVFITYQDQKPIKDISAFVLYESSEILNNFPVAISLSNNVLPDKNQVNDLIGVFSTVDADEEDTHAYSFVEGVGSENNELFTIDGQALKANTLFEFEEDSVFTIRVRSTDSKKGYFEQAFAIENGKITGLDKNDISNKIRVYPNPASKRVVVKLKSTGNGLVKVTLLSINGETILSKDVRSENKVILNIADLARGIYFIQVEQQDQTVIKKLVKK